MKCFAIRFKNGSYFITSADDPQNTFNDFLRRGYDPLTIESVIDNSESYHEWALFREYLAKYGIERVRGASYTQFNLTDVQKQTLLQFMNSWSPIREKTDTDMDLIANKLGGFSISDNNITTMDD
jgi:hypothetical protein